MTRRRAARRRHRAERRERDPDAAQPAPVGPQPRQPAEPWYREISLTGLIGGVTGALALGQAAVYILVVNTEDVSELWAIPIFAAAAVYIPAAWVSVRPHPNRRTVYRTVLAITLVFMVIGAIVFDPAFFGLLLVPSSMLAIAAGMLFRGPQKS
jgi:hypothetical protein